MADPVYGNLTAFKNQMRIDDGIDDALLTEKHQAGSRSVDRHCNRRFFLDATATARIYHPRGRIVTDDDGEQRFLVDDIGNTTGLIVEIGFGASWTAITDVELYPDNAIARGLPVTALIRSGGWRLSGRQRLRVTTRWGWPAEPEDVITATYIQSARLLRRKDSPEGVTASAEWGPVRVSRVDPDVEALLTKFVKFTVA